ncbi:MAG: hypothetical protein HQL69_06835 [Magnetococcales bacterium]|nr:hypothetical protein [Magnetococcales bacterium]
MSNTDLNTEIISRMAQAFPSPVSEAENFSLIPTPLVDGNNIAGATGGAAGALDAGVTGGATGALGAGNGVGGAASGGSATVGGGKAAAKGVAVGSGKSKGALGMLPFKKYSTVAGSASTTTKGKASVSLLPSMVTTPTTSSKHFFLGKALIGSTAILPGIAAYVGPTGLLPSVTAVTAGFGAGILMPAFLFGTLVALASPQNKKAKKTKTDTPPIGETVNKQSQQPKSSQPTSSATPFTYAGYSVKAKSTEYKADKPSTPSKRKTDVDMLDPLYFNKEGDKILSQVDKGGDNIPQHVGFDRRFALRIKVPANTLLVRGVISNGQIFQSVAKDVSMHGVKFSAPKLPIVSIKQLVFKNKNIAIDVQSYRLHRQTDSEAVAILTSFKNGPDDWMQWIERITRMDQGSF